MRSADLYLTLRECCNEKDAALVLSAIINDPILFDALTSTDFLNAIKEWDVDCAYKFAPANLGMLACGSKQFSAELSKSDLPDLDPETKRKSLDSYKALILKEKHPLNIEDAAYLALAWRERRKQLHGYDGFSQEVEGLAAKYKSYGNLIQSAINILSGIVPDPILLWKHLSSSQGIDDSKALAIKAVLTQVSPPEQKAAWIEEIGVYDSSNGVSNLAKAGGIWLVGQLKAEPIAIRGDHNASTTESNGLSDLDEIESTKINLARSIVTRFIEGRDGGKNLRLLPLLLGHDHLQENLDQMLLNLHGDNSDQEVFELCKIANHPAAGLISTTANQDLKSWITRLGEQIHAGSIGIFNRPAFFLNLLHANDSANANKFAQVILEADLLNIYARNWIGENLLADGKFDGAYEQFSILAILEPSNPRYFRQLAEIDESIENWKEAQKNFRKIIDLSEDLTTKDLKGYLQSSVNAGMFDEAISQAKKAIENNPEESTAWFYLGLASKLSGNSDNAESALKHALEITPEMAEAWKELAELYQTQGRDEKALKTLKSAHSITPASADVNYLLAKYLLDHQQNAEALPYLREAAKSSPESSTVAINLIKALTELGYKEEAIAVLEETSRKWPLNKELGFLKAKTLVDLKDYQVASDLLENLLKSDDRHSDWFVLYAKALAGQAGNSDQNVGRNGFENRIQKAILKSLSIDPGNFEARLMLTENSESKDDKHSTFDQFCKLMEDPNALKDEFYWRVQAGFGKVALALGQTEPALAALKNAVAANPRDPQLFQALTQAYTDAGLSTMAREMAGRAIALEPNDTSIKAWFASALTRIGSAEEAKDAIKEALSNDPGNVELQLADVDLLIREGDQEKATESLNTIYDNTNDETILNALIPKFTNVNNWDGVDSVYGKLIELADKDVIGKVVGAVKYFQANNQLERALSYTDYGLEIEPENFELLNQKGELQLQLGLETEASDTFGKALDQLRSVGDGNAISFQSDMVSKVASLFKNAGQFQKAYELYEKKQDYSDSTESELVSKADLARILLKSDDFTELANELRIRFEDARLESQIAAYFVVDSAIAQNNLNFADQVLNQEQSRSVMGVVFDFQSSLVSHRLGKLSKAYAKFADALNKSAHGSTDLSVAAWLTKSSIPPIAQLEAAKELLDWEAGKPAIDELLLRKRKEPVSAYAVSQYLIQQAEWANIAKSLSVSKRLPPDFALSAETHDLVLELLEQLCAYLPSAELQKWKWRAHLAFRPKTEDVEKFLSAPSLTNSDAASIISALIRLDHAEKAIDFAKSVSLSFVATMPLISLDQTQYWDQVHSIVSATQIDSGPVGKAVQAIISFRAGESDVAIRSWQNALDFWQDEPLWLLEAGRLLKTTGETSNAAEYFQRAVEIDPENIEGRLNLAEIQIKSDMGEEAIANLLEASKISPTNGDVWLNLARALELTGNNKEALHAAEKAVQLTKRSTPALIIAGHLHLLAGDIKKASEFAKEAQASALGNPDLALLNAKILQARGKEQDALSLLEIIDIQEKSTLPVHLEKARLIYKLQGAPAAVKFLHPLAETYPGNDEVVGAYASALADCGLFSEAEKAAKQALELNPDKPELQLMLGRLYANSGQYDKAITYFEEVKKKSPGAGDIYLDLGKIYVAKNDLKQALESFNSAITAAPNDHRAYFESAAIYRNRKDYAEAEKMLRKASELRPDDVNIRRQLGAIIALNLVQNAQESTDGSR